MRRGFASIALILLLTVAAALTLRDALAHSARGRELSIRQQRLQGREYALAARSLPASGRLELGAWTLVRQADGGTTASGPIGTWGIDSTGYERWTRSP